MIADPGWLVARTPHMDGSHTLSVLKYDDGRPGTAHAVVPAGYELLRIGDVPPWMRPARHLLTLEIAVHWTDDDALSWERGDPRAWEAHADPLYVMRKSTDD